LPADLDARGPEPLVVAAMALGAVATVAGRVAVRWLTVPVCGVADVPVVAVVAAVPSAVGCDIGGAPVNIFGRSRVVSGRPIMVARDLMPLRAARP
jgi:hypothetical protein